MWKLQLAPRPPPAPQMVEKLVVLCCPHPAAYRDPQRFDSNQIQRLAGRRAWWEVVVGRVCPAALHKPA